MKMTYSQHRWWMFWILSTLSMGYYWSQDNRPLVDLGRYYQAIPDWWMFAESPSFEMFIMLITQMGGWLNAVLALLIWLTNDQKILFMGYAILTSGIFWWSLKRESPLVGWCIIMQPIWQVGWRTQWIHALETSLVLCVWQAWHRSRMSMMTGIVSMLAVWLRPSALIWLLGMCLWDCVRGKMRGQHHILIGSCLGIVLIWPHIMQYLLGKMSVPEIHWSLIDQVGRHGGLIPTVLMMIIVVCRISNIETRYWMCACWVLMALSISIVAGVGLDNFPLFFVGLAVLSGSVELSKQRQMIVIALSITVHLIPFLSLLPERMSPVVHMNTIRDTVYDFQRPIKNPIDALSVSDLHGILERECQFSQPHCLVVTTGFLFHPHRESHGRLPLLSKDLKQLRIEKAELWFRRQEQLRGVQMAIVQECDEASVWPPHFVQAAQMFEDQLSVWSELTSIQTENCKWVIFVPPNIKKTRYSDE